MMHTLKFRNMVTQMIAGPWCTSFGDRENVERLLRGIMFQQSVIDTNEKNIEKLVDDYNILVDANKNHRANDKVANQLIDALHEEIAKKNDQIIELSNDADNHFWDESDLKSLLSQVSQEIENLRKRIAEKEMCDTLHRAILNPVLDFSEIRPVGDPISPEKDLFNHVQSTEMFETIADSVVTTVRPSHTVMPFDGDPGIHPLPTTEYEREVVMKNGERVNTYKPPEPGLPEAKFVACDFVPEEEVFEALRQQGLPTPLIPTVKR